MSIQRMVMDTVLIRQQVLRLLVVTSDVRKPLTPIGQCVLEI